MKAKEQSDTARGARFQESPAVNGKESCHGLTPTTDFGETYGTVF
jgi:hypothetical protein